MQFIWFDFLEQTISETKSDEYFEYNGHNIIPKYAFLEKLGWIYSCVNYWWPLTGTALVPNKDVPSNL